ncbi:hypothetical protein F4808DRAFT_32009 [Astrocystis sublimbata]|nr:hypothetical protein F4808DRAFT_32009 [Astrocystis sublimbata]
MNSEQHAVSLAAGFRARAVDKMEDGSAAAADRRSCQGYWYKYSSKNSNSSNKNRNQAKRYAGAIAGSTGSTGSTTGSTGQPAHQPLARASGHAPAGLARAPQHRQVDPFQSRGKDGQQRDQNHLQQPQHQRDQHQNESQTHTHTHTHTQTEQHQHRRRLGQSPSTSPLPLQHPPDLDLASAAVSAVSSASHYSHNHSFSDPYPYPYPQAQAQAQQAQAYYAHSSSGQAKAHQHHQPGQLYTYYRNSSPSEQPPRLPPLAVSLSSISLSPIDTVAPTSATNADADAVLSSSAPRLPVQPDDIVSPLSETRSSTPNFRSRDRSDGAATAWLPAAQPLTRVSTLNRQPTTHSSAGASVLDDRDFERSLRAADPAEAPAASPTRSVFAAVTSAVAHDVAHLTDERSDDWFRYTARESTISKYTHNSLSHLEPHHMMAADTMPAASMLPAEEPSIPEPPHESERFAIPTTSSFTPLPPIRRTSTFDLMRNKGLGDEDADTMPSPMSSRPPETVQHNNNDLLPEQQGPRYSSPHQSVPQQPQQPQQQLQPTLDSNPYAPHGQSQQPAMSHQPYGPVPSSGPPSQLGVAPAPNVPMHPQHMMMGPGGQAGQQGAPPHMSVNGRGQTVTSFGGRQWVVQESHLAEPLNVTNRSRSGTSPQQNYSTWDKETEGDGPSPRLDGGPSKPVQPRPRNMSNPAPPPAANRYPDLFPPAAPQNAFPRWQGQGQGQAPLQHQQPTVRNPNGIARPGTSYDDDSLAKEMGVRVDQVSEQTSVASEDVNDHKRRGSGGIWGIGHRRQSSSVAGAQQESSDAVPEKKKKNVFSSLAHMSHLQPKPKSNLNTVSQQPNEEPDQQVPPQNQNGNAPPKKLSELKGMIKGVGNAKEGSNDDPPVSIETMHESRQSMQSPPRNFSISPGIQGAQRPPSFGAAGRPGSFGSQVQPYPQGPQGPLPPQSMSNGQQFIPANPPPFMGVGRATTASPQPGRPQQVKSEESGKKSSAGAFFGGLFNKQGNKAKDAKPQPPQQTPPPGQRPMQPPSQPGYNPFHPGQVGQPLGPHPMFAGQPQVQRPPPGQAPSPSPQDLNEPTPPLQKAQIVTIRRPSGMTVGSYQSNSGSQQTSPQRPGMPSPQASQGTFKQRMSPSLVGHGPNQMGLQNENGMPASQTSPRFSNDSALERPVMGNSAGIPRASPNRKPVGSGSSKDGLFMTSAVPATSRPQSTSPTPADQRAPSQLSYVQPNSHGGSSGGFNDMTQPSLPSPETSIAPSQSNHSSSPKLQESQFGRDSPALRGPVQGLGVIPNGPGPNNPKNATGPNGGRPSVPAVASLSAAARNQPPHAPGSPVPSVAQDKLSHFFGAYDGGKPAPKTQANKEKSAASKFLGAFKRSSKQTERAPSPSRPQTSPQLAQQPMRPGVAGPGGVQGPPGAPGQVRIPPVQIGRGRGTSPQMLAHQALQMQAARGQMQAQAGRGQLPPGMMMQGGRGQLPPGMVGGAVPPHVQRPMVPGKQGNEPQYDQVPIPRGYEAVHGYGAGGMLAISPYYASRAGQPIQHPSMPSMAQSGAPQGQWNPRMVQPTQGGPPPGASPGAPQFLPQGTPNNVAFQNQAQQLQPQIQGQASPPVPQQLQPNPPQNPFPQQLRQTQPVHQPGQTSPPVQGQVHPQAVQNQQVQQGQLQGQAFQQNINAAPQAQSNTSWVGAPQDRQSPRSTQQANSPPDINADHNIRAQSPSDSFSSSGSSTSGSIIIPPPSQSVHSNSTYQASPVSQVPNAPTQIPSQEANRPHAQSPSDNNVLRSPDAARLTSRMSVTRLASHGRQGSFGTPVIPTDRSLAVSPEPPGQFHGPIHQVSQQTLGVDVERANGHVRNMSEDIYDATPRVNPNSPPDTVTTPINQEDDNTKYAGSEKGRVFMSPATIAFGPAGGAAAGAAAGADDDAEDTMSFLDPPDSEVDDLTPNADAIATAAVDDKTEMLDTPETRQVAAGEHVQIHTEEQKNEPVTSVSPPQQQATPTIVNNNNNNNNANVEPEEKILVDQPVELAAVRDDDDGIPMMSATSYPGQEWNPYGYGEFGDWE